MHVDPVHDEFFKMQDLADALVREAIQNSLDARRGRASVRVRFRFGVGTDALPAEGARQYFGELRQHLDVVSSSIHSIIPSDAEPVPFLLVEDFGTRGLTGDPGVDPELENETDTKNDFFYFWRNVGRSNKGEIDRGRWGLGKAVFTVASRIRTIFGLTRRADDSRALLLGQSVLKTHIIDNERIYPYGFFARFEKRDGLPLPIEDPLLLERFADDFRLHRNEPGLSVVIPYFRDDELSFERIIESAIRQYFYPIIRGDLTIDVDDGSRKESITAKSIENVSQRYKTESSDAIDRLCELTRWSLINAASQRIEIAAADSDRAPKWSEGLLNEETLKDLRERFERGERIAMRAPILVKRRKAKAAASHFDIYLEKDAALRKPAHHFIRRGITIPDVRSTSAEQAVRALIVVDHEALSTFLGDAENPAHSDWSERADKLRTLYDHHAATLRFIKNSAAYLSSLLSRPPEGRVKDFLQDLFSIEIVEEPGERAPVHIPIKKREAGESEGPGGANGGKPAAVTISRIAGGFTIKGSDEALVARRMSAELAYRARSGNPFRKHSQFDFDLMSGDVAINGDAAIVRRTGVNTIEFTPAAAKFQVSMRGFDAHRDLVVRVTEMDDDAAQTELH